MVLPWTFGLNNSERFFHGNSANPTRNSSVIDERQYFYYDNKWKQFDQQLLAGQINEKEQERKRRRRFYVGTSSLLSARAFTKKEWSY